MVEAKKSTNPLKAILDIKRDELPLALLMFSYFFLVITNFWILKPIKKAAFLTFYKKEPFHFFGAAFDGPQAELFAKVGNMGVAFLAVVAFTRLARTIIRVGGDRPGAHRLDRGKRDNRAGQQGGTLRLERKITGKNFGLKHYRSPNDLSRRESPIKNKSHAGPHLTVTA